jgi:hypothetical protein
MGVEPMTCRLRIGCSTSKLRWQRRRPDHNPGSGARQMRWLATSIATTLRAGNSDFGSRNADLVLSNIAIMGANPVGNDQSPSLITILPKCEPEAIYS